MAIKIGTTNTGASTINVNGLGAKNILDSKGNAMTAGKLNANSIYTLRYNGTAFILQGEGGGGTALVGDILAGKTATVDSGDITGTMPYRGSVTITPSTVDQTIAQGYHDGAGKTIGDPDLVAANIKSGINIFGVVGTAIEATGTALAGDVLTGKTFSKAGQAEIAGAMPNNGAVNRIPSNVAQSIPAGYTSGGTVDAVVVPAGNVLTGTTIAGTAGTMPNNGSPSYTPSTVTQSLAAGYYSGGAVQGDPNLAAANILGGVSIFGVAGTAKRGASGTGTIDGAGNCVVSGLAFTPTFIIVESTGGTASRSSYHSGYNSNNNSANIGTTGAPSTMQTAKPWTVGASNFSVGSGGSPTEGFKWDARE